VCVRSLCRSGLCKTVARELVKFRLVLLEVHEVRCDKASTEQAEDHTFLCGNGNQSLIGYRIFLYIRESCQQQSLIVIGHNV
jgi:hypothetical protein